MIEISIDKSVRQHAPQLALGVIQASVRVTERDLSLGCEIDGCVAEIVQNFRLDRLTELPEIRALREAYRRLGRDPSRYRGSQEALFRRVLQGKGLYRINNVVDINNLISLRCKHSLGTYDLALLQPPVVFRAGRDGENYKGIGKAVIDISYLPVFADELGPFGSPTRDSDRALISSNSQNVLMVIIAFSGTATLIAHMREAKTLLCRYAGSTVAPIHTAIVT
jgi:DNA/RNA-binding domain of Phe-tRNA-synthetase-like protein